MADIRRFSLVYDGEEDRIAWDMLDVEGAVTRLWLTQKLCRRFALAVTEILEKRTAGGAATGHGSALQSFEQAAAMSEFGKTPGVTLTSDAKSGLVRKMQLSSTADGLGLTFEFGDGESRTFGLGVAAVRQTLAVLCKLHEAAGWPDDFWPAWVADPAAPAAPSAVN
jgi:hypothetical protein